MHTFAQLPEPKHIQAPEFDNYVLHIQRSPVPITIDGKLSEEAWNHASYVTNFVQHYPTDSLPARSQVFVRALYDDEYIYFGITCIDSTAGKYYFQSLRRDFGADESDGVMVILDPLSTGQNGFAFRVSPVGVQSEGFVASGGNFGMDRSWDNVWFSEVHSAQHQWTAEIAIPFRSLRFESGRKQWRVNIVRWDWVHNELSTWTRFPINVNAFSLAHTGILEWDVPPSTSSLNMSIIPYAASILQHNLQSDTVPRLGWGAGFDAKWAVTPSLNLDVTVFPDFSNVNADRQITNLQRFSLFFPEQRQFFIENSDLFSQFGFSQIRPFFSRRIGLTDGSRAITIPFGARLSGNLDDNWRIGIMTVQTAAHPEISLSTQNYSVAAVQRRLFGRSNIGAIIVNRQGENYNGQLGNNYNRTVGIDFNLLSNDGVWTGKIFYHHTFTPTLHPDQFATAGWLRYSVPGLELNWNHEYIGTNYNPEVGFVPRTGVWRFQPIVQQTFYPDNRSIVNEHGWGADGDIYLDNSRYFTVLDRSNFLWYYVSFANTVYASAFVGSVYTRLTFPFDASGKGDNDRALPIGEYLYNRFGFEVSSDRRALVVASGAFRTGSYFNGMSTRLNGSITYRFLPFGSIALNLQRDYIMLPQPYNSNQLTLASLQLDFTPTREVFFTAFLQYNTQINNTNLNARMQWRFAPMSDIFLVYTDNYDATSWAARNRGIALKITYWLTI
ncbi:MAG: DUF5916 domain-containing protein [Bacteroidota bacterium]|nr:carbohydrate binding family 9 domain-containing protein [Candidatus Kapabacteria bacterium]MDW8220079.1 DUF5916 domain-containing protein [Bacteroidota bacterium]